MPTITDRKISCELKDRNLICLNQPYFLFNLPLKYTSQILRKIYLPANNDITMIPKIGTTTKPPIKIDAGLK